LDIVLPLGDLSVSFWLVLLILSFCDNSQYVWGDFGLLVLNM